jgi:hypothetical protein
MGVDSTAYIEGGVFKDNTKSLGFKISSDIEPVIN